MNFYIFLRIRTAFGAGKWQWGALVFFGCMLALFLLRRTASGTPWEGAVHTISFLWAGVVLVSIPWFVLLDATRIVIWLVDSFFGTEAGRFLQPTQSVPVVMAICIVLCGYALFEAKNLRTTQVVAPTDKLPPETSNLRIVALSDVHINASTNPRRIERIAETVKAAKPDILLMLGDLVDADMDEKHHEAALLKSMAPSVGAYAILGNHEAYSGLANSTRFLKASGFTTLRSEVARVGDVVIVGMDDPRFFGAGSRGIEAEETACEKLLLSLKKDRQENRFILLLRHRPGKIVPIAGLFDLQLSGHTHGGQIWPAGFIVKNANNGLLKGLTRLSGPHGKSLAHISSGAGFWGPPMRLFTPPEIVVIDLVRPG